MLETFSCHPTYGGYIDFNGVGYFYYDDATTSTVANSYVVIPAREARGYTTYDTSSIPDNATITAAELDVNYITQQGGGAHAPDSWMHSIGCGKDILDGSLSASDWGNAGFKQVATGIPSPGIVTYYFGSKVLLQINKTGNTDIEIKDISTSSFPGGTWSITFWNCSTRTGKLRVWYTLPTIYNCSLYNCRINNA